MRINHDNKSLNSSDGVEAPYLFIGIPTYDGKPTTNCFAAVTNLMLLLQSKGIKSKLMFAKYCGFIDRARNMLINEFLKTDCTHILMNDADQGFDHEKILEMLYKDKMFIAAAVRQKQMEETYAIKVNVDNEFSLKPVEKDGLISTHRIGLALVIIKREVFDKIRTFHKLPHVNSTGTQFTDTHIVQESNGTWDWLGEDYDFCTKCTEASINIWIYHNIDVSHVGYHEFKGNFHEYLLKQPGGSKASTGLRINQLINN
jgi:hypothetical protein